MTDDALDPALKAMLKAAAEAPAGPSIRDLPVPEARAAYRERYLIRGIRAPEAPVAMTEHVLELPDRVIAARLYRPARAGDAPALPLVIYFHGGGFVVGDPAAYDNQSRRLADRLGALVLTPDYRLAPEHPFPAAVADAWDVFSLVAGDAAAWGADPAAIALAGDSAGGCLTLVTALTARDRPHGPQPVAGLALYPVTDFRPNAGKDVSYPSMAAFGRGYFLDTATMDWFCDLLLTGTEDALDPRASPLLWPDIAGTCPIVLVTAGFDPLSDQGDAMAERLAAAGVPVDHLRLPDMIHNFPGYAGLSAGAEAAFARVVDAFGARLLGRTRG
ncbi:MAG: lipolytic enzyme [Tistrella sp.]|nr:alpha/beta hydrolase [uncultured Tistrella sp.]MAM74265.1 lipolytic enzyme [Tistrella sp.]